MTIVITIMCGIALACQYTLGLSGGIAGVWLEITCLGAFKSTKSHPGGPYSHVLLPLPNSVLTTEGFF